MLGGIPPHEAWGGNDRSVVATQVGDHHPGVVALLPQGQQEGLGTLLGVIGVEGDVQQVIGVNVHRQVDVHPALHLGRWLVVLGHQHVLFIHAYHSAGTNHPEQRRHRQQLPPPDAHPTVGGHLADLQGLAHPPVGTVAPGIGLPGQQVHLQLVPGVGYQPGREMGKAALWTGRVAAVVAVHRHLLQLSLRVVEPLLPPLTTLAHHMRRAAQRATNGIHFLGPLPPQQLLHAQQPGQRLQWRRGCHACLPQHSLQVGESHLLFCGRALALFQTRL